MAAISIGDANASAWASASQNSNFGDAEITMSGSVSAAATGGFGAVGISRMTAIFTLDSDAYYASSQSGTGGVDSSFDLYNAQSGFGISLDGNSSGPLPTGEYALLVGFDVAVGNVAGSASGDFNFDFTITPEPSALCLLLVGGLLVAAARRFRR